MKTENWRARVICIWKIYVWLSLGICGLCGIRWMNVLCMNVYFTTFSPLPIETKIKIQLWKQSDKLWGTERSVNQTISNHSNLLPEDKLFPLHWLHLISWLKLSQNKDCVISWIRLLFPIVCHMHYCASFFLHAERRRKCGILSGTNVYTAQLHSVCTAMAN